MAFTTPATWSTAQVVTAANLNEQLRDNMLALSTHTHTGAAGDGAPILIPSFENDKRRYLNIAIPVGNLTGEMMVSEQNNGASSTVWNATDKWTYNQWQVTTNAGYCRCHTQQLVSLAQLPEFQIGCAHVTTATATIRLGLMDGVASADPTNGVYFRCINNGNWFAVTRQASTETATDTGVAASTTSKEFRISVDSTSSITFYINDVLKATNTTNIPATTVLFNGRAGFVTSNTATLNAAIDQFMGLSYRVKSS